MILTYFNEIWEKTAEAGPIMSRFEGVWGINETYQKYFSFPQTSVMNVKVLMLIEILITYCESLNSASLIGALVAVLHNIAR